MNNTVDNSQITLITAGIMSMAYCCVLVGFAGLVK
jgi:Na+-translocating ferredoxin:NAD+ oxidoreductase RnfA subunit